MNDVLLTPIRLNELEQLIENSVERAMKAFGSKQAEASTQSSEKPLSISEAADFLNLSVPTLYSKVSRGQLPVMKRGKRLYFSLPELSDYLKAGRKKSNEEIAAEADQYLVKSKKG
ncbi:MAG: helix-turn-helix domain-containing protein [Algoriphagus aquaeductus]|uniref:helix-turn-helix domain-containing protein n=1 Tax=Algoriphagus aquaeductus TaxID=475299 RepID=UPI00391BA3CC